MAELGEGTVTALLPTVQKMSGGSSEIVSVGDKISAGGQIQTQAQAVAEITFPDGSKIRIGNNSTFSFDPNDRTVRLDRGSALVCTPPAAEGINIVSGGVSGAVAGDPAGKTFLVTAYPADGSGGKTAGATGGFGLVVLQGNAATTVAAPSGSVTIAPGQLAVIGASGGAPSLHTVDLAQVIRSTPLIGGFPTPLPTTGAILNTAIGQQTQISRGVLTPTGTSGVAITFGGQLLTAGSPPPNSAPPSFPMAVSTPGFNGNLTGTATVSQLANINTAGGGGGSGPFGGLTPSGVTGGGGGGPGGPSAPGSINTPNNTGQQGVSANPTPLSATAAVTTKVYDGTTDADLTGAAPGGPANNVSLGNATTGTFASKNVGTGITVTTGMTLTGSGASLYSFTTPTLTGTILAKDLQVFSAAVTTKVYDGSDSAVVTGAVLVGNSTSDTDGKYIGSEVVTLGNNTAGTFASKNVGNRAVATTMTLGGADSGNYTILQPTLTGDITARALQMISSLVSSIEYNGQNTFSETRLWGAADLFNIVGSEEINVTGNGTFVGSPDVAKDSNGNYTGRLANLTYTLGNGANGGLGANYFLDSPPAQALVQITEKTLSYASPSAAPKVYDGTVNASVTLGGVVGLVGSETLTITPSSSFGDKNVGNGKGVTVSFALADGSNGGKASNYRLNNLSLSANITAKPVDVDMTAAVISKAYNGNASVTVTGAALGQIAVGAGTPTDGLAYTGDNVALAANPAVTLQRSLPGTFIPVIGTGFSLTGADSANYNLRNPTGLTGEITGTATLNQNGAALNLSSGQFLHVRNTTASRMQGGMEFTTTAGEVLIENSSFDGWMQRDNTTRVVNGATGTTIPFTETAAVGVNSPVLGIKLDANTAAGAPGFMLLGDYQLRLSHDPSANPTSADVRSVTLFSFPGINTDTVNSLGSIAPSADFVLRDTAATKMQDIHYDIPEYSTLNGSGQAVASGASAPVKGEFRPDNLASALDISTAAGGAAGTWNVTLDQPVISGEAKATDVRLKYNNNTKVLIEGPDGVRLLNVKFEGMDEVDVRTTDLNNRVLMSATLLTDPDITRMVVKASQTLEAVINSDATFQEVKSLSNADLLAGVVRDNSSPTGFSFVGAAERTLTIDGPGAAAATPNVNITGQLAVAAHTVVFNNANIASGGVIDVRTRDGMVNRTYGTVVPGTTSFLGSLGNKFVNTANSQSMTIGTSVDITGAFTGGKLTDFGSGGTGTVMSVGKVQ